MKLQVLHPDVARELLKGHQSCLPGLVEKDEKVRAEIASQSCPQCGENLVPRAPRDPARVFGPDGIRYERCCPRHGRVT